METNVTDKLSFKIFVTVLVFKTRFGVCFVICYMYMCDV